MGSYAASSLALGLWAAATQAGRVSTQWSRAAFPMAGLVRSRFFLSRLLQPGRLSSFGHVPCLQINRVAMQSIGVTSWCCARTRSCMHDMMVSKRQRGSSSSLVFQSGCLPSRWRIPVVQWSVRMSERAFVMSAARVRAFAA